MSNYEYPYTDFNEYNLDWCIKRIRDLTVEWAKTKTEWGDMQTEFTDLKNYVHDYFENLDVQAEIDHKLDEMAADGSLYDIMVPYFSSEVPSIVTDWLQDNITQETGYVIDDSLSVEDAAADAAVTGAIRSTTDGLFTGIENLFYNSDIPLTFQRGFRGATPGASVAVQTSVNWSCSDLVTAVPGDVFTIYNLYPDKYRFVVRAYTEDEANNGVYTSDSVTVLKNDLTSAGTTLNSTYSDVNTGVYKNSVAIIKTTSPSIKYWSIHVRHFGTANITDDEITTLSHGFKIVKNQPFLPYYMRSRIGEFAFLFGPNYGRIDIDTVNNTAIVTGACTLKSGRLRVNNPSFDFTGFDPDQHETIYFDVKDNTVKVIGYFSFISMAGIEDVIYLGSSWPRGTVGPDPWFDINTNMTVTVNDTPQKLGENPIRWLRVVVTGDSICRGGRNAARGFIGDVNNRFVNLGIGGATISNITDSSASTDTQHVMNAANIPDTIVKYASKSGESWYIEPDVIIASGGINDLLDGATLGTVPNKPVHNDTEAAALDLSLVTDSLGFMFYQMIKLFPNAHRFFVITNRQWTRPWTAGSGGYNQTQLHDAIVAVCKLYGVSVIDVFNEGMLDSYFDEYVSPTAYTDDPTVTDLYYIDKDKVHPLALGYKRGYAPLVEAALHKALIE